MNLNPYQGTYLLPPNGIPVNYYRTYESFPYQSNYMYPNMPTMPPPLVRALSPFSQTCHCNPMFAPPPPHFQKFNPNGDRLLHSPRKSGIFISELAAKDKCCSNDASNHDPKPSARAKPISVSFNKMTSTTSLYQANNEDLGSDNTGKIKSILKSSERQECVNQKQMVKIQCDDVSSRSLTSSSNCIHTLGSSNHLQSESEGCLLCGGYRNVTQEAPDVPKSKKPSVSRKHPSETFDSLKEENKSKFHLDKQMCAHPKTGRHRHEEEKNSIGFPAEKPKNNCPDASTQDKDDGIISFFEQCFTEYMNR